MTTEMTMSAAAIEVADLRKSFDDNDVLRGIDITVPTGSVYALLGPNGAGKTTAVRILATLITADAGTATVLGHDVGADPDAIRLSIGVTGQFSAIDELLTGRENLRLMADLAHLDRATAVADVDALLARLDLVEAADRRAQTYSGGMKRRLDLAMTLITRPRLIFLDEPTTGLDPRSRRELWSIVREQVADGVTVLLTTQYLEEADALADRVAVLDDGRLVAEGTPSELKRQVPGGHVHVEFTDGRNERLPSDGSVASLRRILDGLDDRDVAGLTVETADLDDVFLALTGHAATDNDAEEVRA